MEKQGQIWRWEKPLAGTQMFPHHRRWACRAAMVSALRALKDPVEIDGSLWHLGRAQAFNCIMFDCHDPLASAYARRIEKIQKLVDYHKDLRLHTVTTLLG